MTNLVSNFVNEVPGFKTVICTFRMKYSDRTINCNIRIGVLIVRSYNYQVLSMRDKRKVVPKNYPSINRVKLD